MRQEESQDPETNIDKQWDELARWLEIKIQEDDAPRQPPPSPEPQIHTQEPLTSELPQQKDKQCHFHGASLSEREGMSEINK